MGRGGHEYLAVDRTTVHDKSLGEIDQVWRGIARRAESGRSKRGIHDGGDGSFAVRAGNVHRPKGALGVAETRHQCPHVLEAELDTESFEPEQVFKRVRAIHRERSPQALARARQKAPASPREHPSNA